MYVKANKICVRYCIGKRYLEKRLIEPSGYFIPGNDFAGTSL